MKTGASSVNSCGAAAMAYARTLPSIRALGGGGSGEGGGVRGTPPFAGLPRAPRSCAVVGNAGHMRKKAYGEHIDNHDVVIRFNLVPLEKKYVGSKTTVKLLNFASSRKMCHGNSQLLSAAAGKQQESAIRSVMLWHRWSRGQIANCLRKKMPVETSLGVSGGGDSADSRTTYFIYLF